MSSATLFSKLATPALALLLTLGLAASPASAWTGEVSGQFWVDQNVDGIKDPGEPGLGHASLDLVLHDNGPYIGFSWTGDTGSGGNFSFTGLPPGDYTLSVDPLDVYAHTATYDPDGIATLHEVTFSLTSGQQLTGLDFGYARPGVASGTLWKDENADGNRDSLEPVLQDRTVFLLDESEQSILDTQDTWISGNYTFSDLLPGTYVIRVYSNDVPGLEASYDPDGIATLHQAQIVITPGLELDDLDFGYYPTPDIQGYLWHDANANTLRDAGEAILADKKVDLYSASGYRVQTTETNSFGFYYFSGVGLGDHTVRVDSSELTATPQPTYDYDGIATAHEVFLLGSERPWGDLDLDFGYTSSPWTGGLVGYWPMEDGSGSFADDLSGNDYHAVFSGGPLWTTGFLGGALHFDGQSDGLVVGPAPGLDAPQAFTLAAWIQHPSTSYFRSILDKRDAATDGYDLYLNNTGRLFLRVGNQTLTGQAVVADNAWHHVAGVYDGDELRLYVDGQLDALATVGALTIDTDADLLIGAHFDQGNNYFAGRLDEVRIYDIPLYDLEIADLAAYRNGDIESDRLAHWTFDEATGTTTADVSGNGNTGTLLGGVTWSSGYIGGGLAFDGSTSVVEVPASATLDSPTALTMAVWVSHPTTNEFRSLIDKRDTATDGYDLYITNTGRAFVRINNVTVTGNSVITTGIGRHVAAVFDGDTVALYVDGVEEKRVNIGPQTLDTTAPLKLGENFGSGSNLNGHIDEVRIYGRALTPGEVDQLYNYP